MFDWDSNPDLNITPFVDVMLVLMSILMVTAPAVVYRENINLPTGTKTQKVKSKPDIVIRLDRDRVIHFGKKSYSLNNFASEFVLKSIKYSPEQTVFISADKDLKYADIMYLLKTLKRVGFSKVSLLTE